MLEKQIEQDLKAALLGGDQLKVQTLRGLKSALLYLKVEKGKRDTGLSEEEEISVLSKEAKKRQESADLFLKGGNEEKAHAELEEKKIIENYLPEQLEEEDIKKIIATEIVSLGADKPSDMGKVIAAVKEKTAGAADGGTIARMVKEQLGQ